MFVSFNALFKNNCLCYPERLALSYKDKHYSYKELNKRSNQLAYYLKRRGIKKGMIVAIISRNYLERIVCIISLWKLGAAYLPIDPNYPLTRTNFILHDSKVNFVITDSEVCEDSVLNHTWIPIILDDENKEVTFLSVDDLPSSSEFNDTAYIAYTSGSTGEPKGVIITQGNISSVYSAWEKIYKLTCSDKHLQIANFGFDVCSGDIIRALGSGAHLVLCPPEIILQSNRFYELLLQETITVAEFTPTILRRLISYLDQNNLNLYFMRLLICGSDSWYLKEYKKFQSFLNPQARLINSYGTTEATIDSTYFEMNKGTSSQFDEQLPVPLGRPFPNTTIKILNEKFEACLSGVHGEIYIGGGGVALGYLDQPKLTQQKFITLSIGINKNSIFYKTGDLGYYLPDGNIGFLGRADDQIKIMDYRVGLIEVEEALNRYPGVVKAVVVAHFSLDLEENLLVAFITPYQEFEINDHIAFLKNYLPVYAIPTIYLLVPSFPISYHGKLDRLKLASKLTCRDEVDAVQDENKQKWVALNEAEEILLKILKTTLNICSIRNDDCFFNLDTNPLLFDRFLREIELHYSLTLHVEDFAGAHTVNELARVIEVRLAK